VAGLREQREGVRAQASHKGDYDVGERGHEGETQYGFGSARAGWGGRCVDMHGNSIPGWGIRGKALFWAGLWLKF